MQCLLRIRCFISCIFATNLEKESLHWYCLGRLIYFLMIMLILVHLSSSEIISCKECGQRFDTIDALNEHEKSEKEEKELQNKGL
jgi:hypothetical protein